MTLRRWFLILIAVALAGLAGGCRRGSEPAVAANLANKVAPRPVTLYFESADALLAPELRTVQLPASDAASMSLVVAEILKGPANSGNPRPFPPDTQLRGVYLLPDGYAIVDLGGPTLAAGWQTGSHAELMAVFSVVQTLTTNFADIKRVQFLLNGQPAETLAGHVDLEKPLGPRSDFVAKRSAR